MCQVIIDHMSTYLTQSPTLTLGSRVIIYTGSLGAPHTIYTSALGVLDMPGTVVKLPRISGLLHDPFVCIELDTPNSAGVKVVAVDPRRVAPVFTCDTCRLGCDCDGAAGDTDCGHYACWGRADGRTAMRCPDVEIGRARAEAYKVARGWTV